MSKSNQVVNAATYYGPLFKAWVKQAGEKPTAAMLDTVHKLGYRPGKQALFAAMCLRPTGCSAQQMVLACGAPQLNKTFGAGGTAEKGLVKAVPAPATEAGHKVYRLELTARGTAKVAKAAASDTAKPAKATAKRKAGKATVTPVSVPAAAGAVSEPVSEPVTQG